MSQQRPSSTADNTYKRTLLYDDGQYFQKVRGRMTGDYTPPSPYLKTGINVNLQSSAGLVSKGTSYYTTNIQILMFSKEEMAEWFQYIGAQHKYYDEKGTIYLGIVNGEPEIEAIQQESKYLVKVTLTLIRKQDFERRKDHQFEDIERHWAKPYIEEMQAKGIISTYNPDGSPVQAFKPETYGNRSHMVSFMVRNYRYIDRLLRGY